MRNLAPFILLLLVVAVLLRVDFFFTVIYFLVAVVVLSRLWAGRAAGRLRAERRFVPRAFTGDTLTVELAVRNEGWLPVPWLEINESVPVQLQTVPFGRQVVSLGPRERHACPYTLACRRRGYYPLGPVHLRTGDLLGLARRDLTGAAPDHLIVYPRIVPIHRPDLPTRSPLVALSARSSLFEDPSRLMGVRDYQRGDSPRRVHWPATARAARLVVKQYQPAVARETLLCLDLDPEGYDPERRAEATELAIVAAASLAHHVSTREGLPVGLLTAARDPLADGRREFILPPRAGGAALIALLEILARVEVAPAEGGGFVTLVRRARALLPWGATVIVVTGATDPALREALLGLRRHGCAVLLLVVGPGGGSDGADTADAAVAAPVWRIRTEADLERGR